MRRWKKIAVVLVVAVLVASSVLVYAMYESGEFDPFKNGFDGAYFDINNASDVGICMVEGGGNLLPLAFSDTISLTDANGEARTVTAKDIGDNRPISHDRYVVAPSRVHTQLKDAQNKMFYDDEQGNRHMVNVYKNVKDFNGRTHSVNYRQNIVYVEDCGGFLLFTYYRHNMMDVYNHLNYHGGFWSRDYDYASALIDKSTGRTYSVTGLWCGCTYDKYEGTNDIMPSIRYFGKINGEDAFMINVERSLGENHKQTTGTFYDKRGLFTISVADNKLVYRELITERNAGWGVEYDSDGNRITVFDEGSPFLGYEFDRYRNDVVHYYKIYNLLRSDFSVEHYLWFPDTGESLLVDKDSIFECDGYVCSSVSYSNVFFPTDCTRYKSDGTTETVSFDDAESYRIASEHTYNSMVDKVTGNGSTTLYLVSEKQVIDNPPDYVIDRVTLNSDCTYTTDGDIFGQSMFNGGAVNYGLVIYDHRLFYGYQVEKKSSLNIDTNINHKNAGYILHENKLYKIGDNLLEIYDLSTGTTSTKSFEEMKDLLYIYVDGDERFIAEGTTENWYCKAVLKDDGSFDMSPTNLELDVVKKVKTN